jgi:ferredoxin
MADPDRCVGSGQCVLTSPTVFDQTDDEGLVVVLHADPAVELLDSVRVAVAACPAQALSLVE